MRLSSGVPCGRGLGYETRLVSTTARARILPHGRRGIHRLSMIHHDHAGALFFLFPFPHSSFCPFPLA